MSKPVELLVKPRGKPIPKLPESTYARPEERITEVYERIAAKAKFDINRLRITKGSDGIFVPNDRRITVRSAGLANQSTLFVKDLGPQIAWRTVFIIEYLGPLLIHPLFFYMRPQLYDNPNKIYWNGTYPEPSRAQVASMLMITLHFFKREIETMFIHRFSSATMPIFNIFKNSAHYWLLAGFNIAWWVYDPRSNAAAPISNTTYYTALVLYVVGEICNFWAHLTLMNLRTPGTKERKIPTGGVYEFTPVTCPNYFYETLAWVGICMMTKSSTTVLFVVIAVTQMAIWARQKETRYRKEFDDYEHKSYSMIPGLF